MGNLAESLFTYDFQATARSIEPLFDNADSVFKTPVCWEQREFGPWNSSRRKDKYCSDLAEFMFDLEGKDQMRELIDVAKGFINNIKTMPPPSQTAPKTQTETQTPA